MRFNPKESVSIVTGASSGIGRSLARMLAERGSRVVVVARRKERLSEMVEQWGSDSIVPVVGDITESGTRKAVIEMATRLGEGRIDLLVNNAGIGAIGPFADATPERLRKIMEVNFFAPVELIRAALPGLQQGRRAVICNLSSVLGHRAVPEKSEYCASKFAMHGFSDSLRAELAGTGIQVTLVSPSTTRSEFFESLVDTDPSQKSKSIGSWTPKRVAQAAFSAICKRRSEVILSLGGKALVYADRISPPLMNRILAK